MSSKCWKVPFVGLLHLLTGDPKRETGRNCCGKHAGSDLRLIWISSEVLSRSGPSGFCTLACFHAGSVWLKPNTVSQNQIRSGLVLYNNMVQDICGRMQQSLKVRNWQQADCILPELSLMILAHRLASRPDVFGQNLTRPSRLDPGQFCTL